jgi:hypothetical protein
MQSGAALFAAGAAAAAFRRKLDFRAVIHAPLLPFSFPAEQIQSTKSEIRNKIQ